MSVHLLFIQVLTSFELSLSLLILFILDILDTLKKSNFAKVMTTNTINNFVNQRIEALQKFEASDAEYVLFLNCSVILQNHVTLKVLVKHNQHVVTPMIRVNLFRPSYRQTCAKVNLKFHVMFPHVECRTTWTNDLYYVCFCFVSLITILVL